MMFSNGQFGPSKFNASTSKKYIFSFVCSLKLMLNEDVSLLAVFGLIAFVGILLEYRGRYIEVHLS